MKLDRIIWSLIILLIVFSYPIYYYFDTTQYKGEEQIKLGFSVENNTLYNLKIVEKKIDRKVDIFHIFQKINEPTKIDKIQEILNNGYIVLLTLEPWDEFDRDNEIYIPKNVLNGSIDKEISEWNASLRLLDYKSGQLIISVCHETNGNGYPWGAYYKNNTIGDAIKEYQYIVEKLKNDKLLIMWRINRITYGWKAIETDIRPNPSEFYPGNNYVDIIGVNGYNRNSSNWMMFSKIYDKFYKDVSVFQKPIWIGETATITNGGNKSEWIKDAFYQIKNNYPNIKAVIWFNEGKNVNGDIHDWQFDSTVESMLVFKESVKYENMKRKKQKFSVIFKY